MTLKRIVITFLFSFLYTCSFGQTVDILQLKGQKFYREKSLFINKDVLTIAYQLFFDIPEMNDEEYCQSLTFIIKNLKTLKPGSIFNLQKDSLVINPKYYLTGAWRFEGADSYSGYIKVLSVTEIEIKLDLELVVEAGKKYIYKGIRTFTKAEKISPI
jgi:hypothetical protein